MPVNYSLVATPTAEAGVTPQTSLSARVVNLFVLPGRCRAVRQL
jgi:hypothetical protein